MDANIYKPKDANRTKDEALVEELFYGRRMVQSKTGRARHEYLPPDSGREREAMQALVRLLIRADIEPLPDTILSALASALNPKGKSARKLVFEFRKKGKRSDLSADYQVAYHVAFLVTKEGWPVEAAVSDAKEANGLSRKAVFEALRRTKKKFPATSSVV